MPFLSSKYDLISRGELVDFFDILLGANKFFIVRALVKVTCGTSGSSGARRLSNNKVL